MAHTGSLGIQGDLSKLQVHVLGSRSPCSGNQRLGFLLGSCNLIVPPGPSLSSSTGEGLTAADHGDSDLSRVDRINVVISAVELRPELAPIHLPTSADELKFQKGSKEEFPNLDPLYAFLQERRLESGGDNPEVLNEQDLGFLVNHIRIGTIGTHKSGWH